jgi:hypothetical protein
VNKVQRVSQKQLDKIAEDHRIPQRIRSRELKPEVQNRGDSRKWEGGVSEIVSYYDSSGRYVCTYHRVLNKYRKRVHWHVKNVTVNGKRYGLL